MIRTASRTHLGRRDVSGRRPVATTIRLAVLPGRHPEWRPPHRLVGLIYRGAGSVVLRPVVTV